MAIPESLRCGEGAKISSGRLSAVSSALRRKHEGDRRAWEGYGYDVPTEVSLTEAEVALVSGLDPRS